MGDRRNPVMLTYLNYLFTLLAYPFSKRFFIGCVCPKETSLITRIACGRRLCCYRSLDARREVGGLAQPAWSRKPTCASKKRAKLHAARVRAVSSLHLSHGQSEANDQHKSN